MLENIRVDIVESQKASFESSDFIRMISFELQLYLNDINNAFFLSSYKSWWDFIIDFFLIATVRSATTKVEMTYKIWHSLCYIRFNILIYLPHIEIQMK